MVATLIRVTGDWELAQDCAQDAFARALDRWPREGVPANPGAWLTTVARNRALDRLPDAGLQRYHLWPAVRADLLRRLGRTGDAVAFYRQARELAPSEIERRYLDRRIAECLTAERG